MTMSANVRAFALGDRVRHAARPEWGVGEITAAESLVQDGKPTQRLVIRFERGGFKTLSSAFADLRPASELPPVASEKSIDPLAAPDESAEERLLAIPDTATDPFIPLKKRMIATLGLYRFTGNGGSLIDWACMQTGLKDPMVRFNRHELEEFFKRFRFALDQHLARLGKDARRQEPGLLDELAPTIGADARQVLRRADVMR